MDVIEQIEKENMRLDIPQFDAGDTVKVHVKIKEGENIDRALKRYKRKFKNIKVIQELRERKQFTKKSVIRRKQIQNAQYKEQMFRDKE